MPPRPTTIAAVVITGAGRNFRWWRRHPRVRRADGRADAAAGHRTDRGKRQSQSSPRSMARHSAAACEIALGCHHRIAVADGQARPARSETRHRAGRRRHAAPASPYRHAAAVELIASGRIVSAAEALSLGIVDRRRGGDLTGEAIACRAEPCRPAAAPHRRACRSAVPTKRLRSRRQRKCCRGRAARRLPPKPCASCAAPAEATARRRAGRGARDLPAAARFRPGEGAAPCLLRRARGGQGAGPRRHRAPTGAHDRHCRNRPDGLGHRGRGARRRLPRHRRRADAGSRRQGPRAYRRAARSGREIRPA